MRTRDEIMTQWDAIRRDIAGGCTNSGPRDWLEGVLDERELRIAELEAALAALVAWVKTDDFPGRDEAMSRARAALKR